MAEEQAAVQRVTRGVLSLGPVPMWYSRASSGKLSFELDPGIDVNFLGYFLGFSEPPGP